VYPVTGITAKWAYLAMIAGFAGLGVTALTTFVRLLQAGDPLAVRAHHLEEDV
jgi:TRAP-type C4-dicarboxylate transport system permease small subunit